MIFSFIAPILIIGAILLSVSLLSYIPPVQGIADAICTQILHFLAIFGSGSSLHGIFIIAVTCTFVGALFDAYAFYRYRKLHDNS